jgi:hypothetical protein
MKFAHRFLVLSLALLTLIASGCSGGGGGGDDSPAGDTTDPTVSVSALPSTVNRTIDIEATADDAVGVTEVEFFVDGTSVGTDSSSPYTASWDTSTVDDGDHEITAVARDAAGNSGTSAPVTAAVRNQLEFAVTLSGEQEFPVTGSAGSAAGTISVDAVTGEVAGSINVDGFTATAAHIHDAFAGINGDILIGLEANDSDPNLFEVPDGAILTSEQVDRLLAGGLYINAHSDAFPGGEVRAQLLPSNITLIFTDLTGAEEVPPVATDGSARAATTVDTDASVVTINVNTVELPTANAAHIHAAPPGEVGDVIVPLEQDATTSSLWFATAVEVTAEQLAAFEANDWYVNVHTPENPDGEVRGQIIAAAGPEAFTFTEIQTQIFNARCTGCHSGAAAPQGLNLSAGSSYDLLVDVDSNEVPALKRVDPGNADESYIIRKLEGAAGIVGGRMPLGGPYLDQDTIDRIRAWIDEGAPEN